MTKSEISALPTQVNNRLLYAADAQQFFTIRAGDDGADAHPLGRGDHHTITVANATARKLLSTYTSVGGAQPGTTTVMQADNPYVLWQLVAADVTSDASWIATPFSSERSGVLSPSLLPVSTLMVIVPVVNQAARLALTLLQILGKIAFQIDTDSAWALIDAGDPADVGSWRQIGGAATPPPPPDPVVSPYDLGVIAAETTLVMDLTNGPEQFSLEATNFLIASPIGGTTSEPAQLALTFHTASNPENLAFSPDIQVAGGDSFALEADRAYRIEFHRKGRLWCLGEIYGPTLID